VLRVGTLDNPDLLKPTAHIYTSTKQSWIKLGNDIPAFEVGYDPRTVWSEDMLSRFKQCTGVVPTSWWSMALQFEDVNSCWWHSRVYHGFPLGFEEVKD
jgi:hypothetical protein